MNKKQLEALGIDKTTAKKIFKIVGRDRELLIKKINRENKCLFEENKRKRAAISAIVSVLDTDEQLQAVLEFCAITQRIEAAKKTREKDGEKVAYYTVCDECGALLDPGEACDCKKEEQANPKTHNQTDEEPAQAPQES